MNHQLGLCPAHKGLQVLIICLQCNRIWCCSFMGCHFFERERERDFGRPPSFVLNIPWGAAGHLTSVKETCTRGIFRVPLSEGQSCPLYSLRSYFLSVLMNSAFAKPQPVPVETWEETHLSPRIMVREQPALPNHLSALGNLPPRYSLVSRANCEEYFPQRGAWRAVQLQPEQ